MPKNLQPLTLNAVLFKPASQLQSQGDHPLVLTGISFFEVFQKTPYRLAAGRENGKADHNEKNSLKEGEEKTKDSKPDEDPSDDQNPNFLEFVHGSICFNI